MPETADTSAPVIGWEGLLVPYAAVTRSSDGRAVDRPAMGARIRGLPVGLKWQREATYEHDRAMTGLATITKTWDGNGGIWGSGPIDTADPMGAELARKIDEGYVGHVSVDLADWTMTYDDSSGRVVEKLTDFELIAATLVNDAAFGQARVYAVRDPAKITPNGELLAQRRAEADKIMAFSAEPAKVLAFGDAGVRVNLRGSGTVSHAVTVATDLPWAPRDHAWDESAARARVAELCGGVGQIRADCYGRAFLWRDPDSDASNVTAYSMPVADVIDGRLHLVYRAVSSAAGRLGQLSVSPADRDKIAARLRALYSKAADALGGDGPPITTPEGLAMAETQTMADQLPAELVDPDDDRSDREALAELVADKVVAKLRGAEMSTRRAERAAAAERSMREARAAAAYARMGMAS